MKNLPCGKSAHGGVTIELMFVALLVLLLQSTAVNAADRFDCRVNPKFSSRDSLVQGVFDFIRQRNPQTPNVKASEFMDNRYIKELDDSGFIKTLYGR